MNATQTEILNACAQGALTGALTFPEILGRLASIGVERYHADYSRQEITYYLADGGSLVVPSPHAAAPPAEDFHADQIAASVGQSQRGEHTYLDFIHKTLAAGCVGYFVYLAGRHVTYLGRRGEQHVERFPD